MLTKDQERFLGSLYFDTKQPGSFSGVQKFYSEVKKKRKDISKNEVRVWLQNQPSYSLFKQLSRKVKRPKVLSPFKFYMLDGDTANFSSFADENDGYKYIAVFIDILSHYLYAFPLKTLKATEMKNVLIKLFNEVHPYILRTDRGSEFKGEVKGLLNKMKIKLVNTSEHSKANYAERVIRTLRLRLARAWRNKHSHNWITILPEIVHSYNNTFHRTIKMSPSEALNTDDVRLWNIQYKTDNQNDNIKKTSLKIGDVVRISKIPEKFDKESAAKWTEELFTISSVYFVQGYPRITLKDFNNEPIVDSFLPSELQKVEVSDSTTYDIEKILKRRKRKGQSEVLVRWKGWPPKFDSWIPAKEVKDFQ